MAHALASRLTRKYQTTVPKPVRETLRLQAGDSVVFQIEDDVVTLRRAAPADVEYLKALEGTLSEWSSPADEEAFRDL